MDKFGIFNLLSSLLGQNAPKSDSQSQDNFKNTPNFRDVSPEVQAAKTRASLPPLQNSMLLTMKTHDEFIKRVKDNQKNKK